MARASAHSNRRVSTMFVVVAKDKDTGSTISFMSFKVRAEAERYLRNIQALPKVAAEIVEDRT